ncbi:MAG: hypothetical protein DHS20C18_44950 [Saprospiraceae bacterium]|nr:MAG: hypothetical protein DHS20C18_44950 [Saprospiraceae bacterium]
MYTTHAQEWVQQHPFYNIVQLNDVEVTPEGFGIVSGGNRLVLLTTDFGETWEESATNVPASFSEVNILMLNDQPILFGASSGTLYKSDNWGESWQTMVSGISTGSISYLYLTDENTIYAGGQLRLIKSTDAGENWTEITPAADLNWNTVFFLDNDNGWAGTNDGDIYQTTNGGDSWTLINDDLFEDPMTLVFSSTTVGFLAVKRECWKTTDGGQNWVLLNEDAFGAYPRELEIIDENHLVGARGSAGYATDDGGITWERTVPVEYAYSNEGVCALPDGRAWIVGSYRAIAYSENGGFSFIDQVPGNRNSLSLIDFVDEQNGWVLGGNETLLRTSNGGDEWTEIALPEDFNVSIQNDGVAFSADEFWLSSSRKIFRTLDAGVTWDSIYEGNGIVYGMTIAGNKVFAITSQGGISKGNVSGDGWEELSSGIDEWLTDIQFPSELVGYVVGRNGTILKTTDGGDNWTMLDAQTTTNFQSVYFNDEQTGWIVQNSNSDELLFTEDGGQTWTVQNVSLSTFWKKIQFIDAQTGFLVGGSANSGKVAQTIDGGTTWETIHYNNSLTNDLAIITTPTAQNVWICGQGGKIEYIDFLSTGIWETAAIETIALSPNPSTGLFYMDLPQELSSKASLSIYDVLGRLQLKQAISKTIDLTALPDGSYTLIIQDQQSIYQAKVIKQRN